MGRMGRRAGVLLVVAVAVVLSGCAATRSPVQERYGGSALKNVGAEPVSLLLYFRHLAQQRGYDTIPKVQATGVRDFDDVLRNALTEITNLSAYTTFTEGPNDVNLPARREEAQRLREKHDFSLDVTVLVESSFKQNFLSGTVSVLSLTILPAPYSWDYTITADLRDRSGKLVKSYVRKATLTNWVDIFLIFSYPFYPMEGKREEIYSESLRDIFRQVEAEKVLKK